MKLASQMFAALAAGSLILALAPASHAQSAGHGLLPVIDGTSPLGPMHGGGQGLWFAPGVAEGRVYAKLTDSQGVERFTLDATVTEYLFFVAAPAQGEIHGQLLIPHVAPSRQYVFALTEIYAVVEGMWIETGNGRGAFTASILRPSDDPDAPLIQIGELQGTFQLLKEPQGGRIEPNPSESASASAGGAGSAANAGNRARAKPPPEILVGSIVPDGHGLQLVGDDTGSRKSRPSTRTLNNHSGLGQVGQIGGAPGLDSTTVLGLRGRLALRWQLFE